MSRFVGVGDLCFPSGCTFYFHVTPAELRIEVSVVLCFFYKQGTLTELKSISFVALRLQHSSLASMVFDFRITINLNPNNPINPKNHGSDRLYIFYS
ncbi:MAG: hypothetical protein RO257_12420 [Candidatus Kapabacteria bacterium]|nr:hypothetical protein [Candidatus Kapabacteria bacterium]